MHLPCAVQAKDENFSPGSGRRLCSGLPRVNGGNRGSGGWPPGSRWNAEDGRARGAAMLSIEYLDILKRHHEEVRRFGRARGSTDNWIGVRRMERLHWLRGG